MTGERYEQTCSQPSTDSYKIPTQLIFKYYFKKLSQNFHPLIGLLGETQVAEDPVTPAQA